ncbi:hypothetical protein SXANM310S_00014 [Streptomyces xanthochromogenes]
MGLFDRFRRKGRDKEEQRPTPAPAPPTPAPKAPADTQGEKKRGLFGRVADRLRGKKEAPPAAPSAPEEAAPPPMPPAPPTGEPVPQGEQLSLPQEEAEGGGEEEAEGEGEEEDYSNAPGSLDVSIPGDWKVSRKRWRGTVKGLLTGQANVIQFLKALDQGRESDAVMMICRLFDQGSGFAEIVDLDDSTWDSINY